MINTLYVISLSLIFAVCMKLADNLNEHNLKLFRGANILFGILYGIFGSLLILYNNLLANLWIAVLIGYILRAKIDKLNHGIASTIMLLVFIFNLDNFQFNVNLFFTFFIGMVVFGFIHDYFNYSKKISKNTSEYFHTIFYYTLLPLAYSILTKEWIIFTSFFSFIIGYEIIRFYGAKR